MRVQRRRAAQPPRRARRPRGRGRGHLRPGLDRRPARRAAHRGAGRCACSTGTTRDPDEIVAVVPPDLVECTVEKVAINAVHGRLQARVPAGGARRGRGGLHRRVQHARPAGHDLLLRARSSIVNGPIAARIGMNSGVNALGQGNRANATIGRALQLVVRNVGGGRPGGVDRATLGNPGKFTLLLRRGRGRLAVGAAARRARAAPRGVDAVTLFAGEGVRGDRRPAVAARPSRWPARSPPACARSPHPKLVARLRRASLVVSPEHARVFREAGWRRHGCATSSTALLPARRRRAGPRRRRHRRGPARGVRRRDRAQVPGRRPADRARRRRRRPVLGHHRRLGQRAAAAASPSTREVRSVSVTTRVCSTRPASERRSGRAHAPGASDLARGPDRRPARHLQAPRRRVPRPARGRCSRRARPTRRALHASRPSPSRRRSTCATRSPATCDVVIEALAD